MRIGVLTPRRFMPFALVVALLSPTIALAHGNSNHSIELHLIGTYASNHFNQGGSEIAAYDSRRHRLFVVNLADAAVDVIDIRDPDSPALLFQIDITPFGSQANSVAVHDGLVAVAVEAQVKTDPGKVVFFNRRGDLLSFVTVGSLPDMLTFTPDGKRVLVANEGEPNSYGQPTSVDPEGSVSIIDVKHGGDCVTQDDVKTAGFSAFNNVPLDPSVRVFGPGATVAQDFEPEYIAMSDSKTAWVTLQENNAVGVLDIRRGKFTDIIGLGFKNHALTGNAFDGSDRDGPGNSPSINIANWPVFGLYLPDGISAYEKFGKTFYVTANEGDARDYTGFAEEIRVSALSLDAVAFPTGAQLKTNAQIGRLTVTRTLGDTGADGDYEALYALGGRSFSIWNERGQLVFDSGDAFEQITADAFPLNVNATNDANDFDTRSDNKGPEPEGVELGEIRGRTYAFIGLERIGGIMVYDITNPFSPRFIQYVNNRNFLGVPAAGTAGDLGPEGVLFIPKNDSPVRHPLLVVANEISGTTSIYKILTNH